jgi:putative nucleotidyltransferase with HDIG domain
MATVSRSIKKIEIADLKPGMYISDLGAGWMDHPFLRNNFAVKDDAVIDKIVKTGIREVYIDTSRGHDVQHAPTREEVEEKLTEQLKQVVAEPRVSERIAFRDEAVRAVKVRDEANQIAHEVLAGVRMGKQVDIEKLEPVVQEMTESILRNGNALVSLCRVKDKDDYTFLHSVSVCALLVSFCRAVGMEKSNIQLVGIGGLLHDIGKMKVPNAILNKPGKLTDEEFVQMKSHVAASMEILSLTPGIQPDSILVAHQHHERHDGSGYPLKLKGDEISRIGQMAAVCDVYDAITSDRCYHKGMAPHDALRKILEWSKYHFNPDVAQQFIRTIGIYPVGTLVMLESGKIGIVHDQNEGGSLLQPLVRVVFDSKTGSYVTPADVDLSKPLGHGGGNRIISHELPEKWGIDLSRFQ